MTKPSRFLKFKKHALETKNEVPGQLLLSYLDKNIQVGCIEFVLNGQTIRVGKFDQEISPITIRVNDAGFLDQLLVYGNLALAEAYIRGDFDVDNDDISGFVRILLKNDLDQKVRSRNSIGLAIKFALIKSKNFFRGRHGNIHHHFDIGNDLYESFLDKTLAYSCGYISNPDNSLDQIQADKYHRILSKLQINSGDRLADIGCGFGGLLIYAAKHHGVTGVGLTISKQQYEKANELIFKEGLTEQIKIKYASYETLSGTYDKIVSVGMMEHLRNDEYSRCIKRINKQLAPNGRGLIHFIGSNGLENKNDPFVQKYIFPGAHWPCLSRLVSELEFNRLCILDVENLIRHYTLTLQHWLGKFKENFSSLDNKKYDEKFRRMWEYYLGCAIAASMESPVALYQILFTRDRAGQIPYQRI